MPIELKMPALSPTMEEGTLARWLVKEGDAVKSGDVLAEIETDKATMEFEAVDEGTLARIVVAEGTSGVKVGTVIALIEGEDEEGTAAPAASEDKPAGNGTAEDRTQPDAGAEDRGRAGAAEPAPEAPAAAASGASDGAAPAETEKGATADAQPKEERKAEDGEVTSPESAAPQQMPTAARALVADVATTEDAPEGADCAETVRMTVREALKEAMAEEMRADDRVFVMGEEVAEYQGAYKVTQGLLEEFGARRVIDTPITEYGFAGIGTGAAMAGLRPIVEFMTFNFAMQAIDHIVNSAAKTNYMSGGQMRCPIVFRGPNGAAARVAAQHSQNYAPWYASVPGLVVIAPYSAADAKGLLKAAIRSNDPVVFLENELLYGQSFDVPRVHDYVLPIGKAHVVRPGKDVTLVSYTIGVGVALKAAEALAEEGIDAEVIDLRTLRPLDTATVLASLKKTNRMVVVEEGWPTCSIASEIIAVVMAEGFDDLDAPVLRVTNADVPLPYAANLEMAALVTADQVVAAAKKVC